MTHFQIASYYLNNKRELGVLEKSFLNIKDQLELYENQHRLTLSAYMNSWSKELDKLAERFKLLETRAEERYKEAIGTKDPENQDNIDFATHSSGILYLSHRNNEDNENINIKYADFFDLFEKSTLIALYSLNENFLNKTCDLTSQKFKQKIKVSHFNSRDYLKASINYLELVIDVPIKSLEKYISKLKDIQALRNKIIHAGSQASDASILKIINKYSDSLSYEKEKESLKIPKPNFNVDFFKLLKDFYEEIFWLLEERQNCNTIKNIFENWFGLIEEKITVSDINYKKTSEKIRTITFKINSDNENISELNGKLTFKRSKGYIFEIINQSTCDIIDEFTDAQTKTDGIYLEQELKTFMSFDKTLDVRLLIY